MKVILCVVFIFCSSWLLAQKKSSITSTDTTFYPSGKIQYVTYRINGEVFKDIFYYENNGAKLSEHTFIDGILNGTTFIYYESGALKTKIIYREGKLSGKTESYYQNAALKQEGFFKNGNANGLWFQYDSLGNKTAQVKYVNGKRQGEKIAYYKNGNVAVKILYENDNMSDIRKGYSPDGKLRYQINLKKGICLFYDHDGGLINGRFVFLEPDSTVQIDTYCVKGKPQNEAKIYENGEVKIIIPFRSGMLHGTAYYYDNKGQVVKIKVYDSGKLVKEENLKKEKVKNGKEDYLED